jgi:hypothetical protein
MASVNWQLYGGLAAAAVGGVILLAMVLGAALGLGVLMFRVCSGNAQFARNRRRKSQHRMMVPYPNGANSSPASLLSGGATDDTLPGGVPAYQPEGKDHG